MSDKKIKQPNSETHLEELEDEQLEDAQGGYKYELRDVVVTSYQTGGASQDAVPEPKTKKLSSK